MLNKQFILEAEFEIYKLNYLDFNEAFTSSENNLSSNFIGTYNLDYEMFGQL